MSSTSRTISALQLAIVTSSPNLVLALIAVHHVLRVADLIKTNVLLVLLPIL